MSDRRPVLPGYDVAWDEVAGEWCAVSDKHGTVLRGGSERELELARNAIVMDLVADLREIFRQAPALGYSPPPPQ